MDAIEQLSGSFGDEELAAEVKRLEAKCAEQRALIDRWNACNAREVEAMNKAGRLVEEMRERCVRQDAEIERLRAELAAEREAVRVLADRLVFVQTDTKKTVDLALAQFGYDDIRFADVRHGGLSAMVACVGIDNEIASAAIAKGNG